MKALISVSDKTGVMDLARGLQSLGIEIISTGGTEAALRNEGIAVTNVSDITGFPECLDGRVKTLHPGIHAGILAKRDDIGHMSRISELNINTIDIVVVNLYPFKQTISKPHCSLEDAIENIDIGGPAMLRSAAKNYRSVSVVVDPSDYPILVEYLKEGRALNELNFNFAVKAFEHTAAYDSLIASYLREKTGLTEFPERLTLTFELLNKMRYGENQHQRAAFYREPLSVCGTLAEAKQEHGKELSFNNINDANSAIEILKEFDEPTVVVVKHATPCGVGSADTIYKAFMKAYEADKVSIFGGIIAVNRELDEETAKEINKLFVEIVIAPAYSEKSITILKQKQNLRIISLLDTDKQNAGLGPDIKKVRGGLLVQGSDNYLIDEKNIKCVTSKKPTENEMDDLLFALKLVKHVKSNAIVIAKSKQSLGIGSGQTSRIRACKQAIEQGSELLEATNGAVMASDAFFPMEDCVCAAANAGITAIIQPGGSIGDEKSIEECNKHNIAMIFTGIRHFKH